jgi:hypothetical protein
MFEQKNVRNYVILFAVVAIASYFGKQLKQSFEVQEKQEEYELIRKYLLNDGDDSPFQNYHKPKLWIHTKYEINARKWKSFQSRNTTELNMPYIHLTIKTIIEHCGNDFNICLIDDDSFSKLIPSWDTNLFSMSEPFRSRAREMGLAMLLYKYGGMLVPNSFVCTKNLSGLFQEGTSSNRPFVCERINRLANFKHDDKTMLFVPDSYFMGCRKADVTMGEFIDYLRLQSMNPHFQVQTEFSGDSSRWFMRAIDAGKMNWISGKKVGVKTTNNKSILLEELMEEAPLSLDPVCYGIYIPYEDILKRNKYQWFAVLSLEEMTTLNPPPIIVHYLKEALIDGHGRMDPGDGLIHENVAYRYTIGSTPI